MTRPKTPRRKSRPPRRSRTAGILRRLNADFRLAIVLSFGGFAALVIGAFAVYRFASAHWLGGTVDLAIVAGIVAVLAYGWRSGDTTRAGGLFAVIASVACIGSALVFGHTAVLWGYVVLWTNFLVAPRRLALGCNVVLITAMLLVPDLFPSAIEHITYGVTAGLVTVYGYQFSQRFLRQQAMLMALASRDPLTGAGNRRQMRQELSEAVNGFREHGVPQTLAVMDLDHFKLVNDHHGHESGDLALKEFSERIRHSIRAGDGFYRFGGEEFVWRIPDLDAEAALRAVQGLHREVSGSIQTPQGPLRFSAGVATLTKGETISDWLARCRPVPSQAAATGCGPLVSRRSTSTASHTPPAAIIRVMTRAEPASLALAANGCSSGPMRSMAASMAELASSPASTSTHTSSSTAKVVQVAASHQASGISTTRTTTWKRNAASSLHTRA